MPKRNDIKKILIIGSGPIVIGQACEFDYSGSQACKVLKKEGYKIILVNSNPATIMTDPEMSDATYIEPLTLEVLEKIIKKERPDALLSTMGGQTGLNLSVELAENGVLKKYGVELIGADLRAIRKAEDRKLFKQAMEKIKVPLPRSDYAKNLKEAKKIAKRLGFPLVIRPSFTLGGTGGAIVENDDQLEKLVLKGLSLSPVHKVLIEESVIGWKEFELEVMRDKHNNVVIVCSIENFDPMGIHTGDSITVAPQQTLSDKEYQNMRDWAIKIIREIGVDTGGSNIQFGINPNDGRIVAIEMNPRVSRSSALASKATGFPIAKIAALLAVGFTLDEIPNDITKKTPASFEPTIDYVVVKVPRFTFEKFLEADQRLTISMKSVGEVMAIGRTFKEALQKAIRGLEIGRHGLGADGKGQVPAVERLCGQSDHSIEKKAYLEQVKYKLNVPNCDRIFNIRYGLELGLTVDEISKISKIDKWFIHQIKEIVELEKEIRDEGRGTSREVLQKAKQYGFSDYQLGYLTGKKEKEIKSLRKKLGVSPTYKMVDTCAGEFPAHTPYFYSTYEKEDEIIGDEGRGTSIKKIMILGGGPNRIGQGIEFDYCCVHASFALREEGFETIMVNCNPETVSTDYDTSSRLYFEPVTLEDVLNIAEKEKPAGTIVQFGGQTPLNLALALEKHGVKIIGTSPDSIDLAEDRERFSKLLKKLNIPQPSSKSTADIQEAVRIAKNIGYPVIIRPSYVLGGRAMEIAYEENDLKNYLNRGDFPKNQSFLIDKFLEDAMELDVDAVSDGENTFIGGIMEHIEEAGIHSGDSACIIPPNISKKYLRIIVDYTKKLARALKVVGIMNIQCAIKNGIIYILEVNPRASRTIPFVSKSIGIPLAKIGAKVMAGRKLKDILPNKVITQSTPHIKYVSVKESVFPFLRFAEVDPVLGPEMRSTGEVMGIDNNFGKAFIKAQIGAGQKIPYQGLIFISVNNRDKAQISPIARELVNTGFNIIATRSTRAILEKSGLICQGISKIGKGKPDILDIINEKKVELIINTPSGKKKAISDGSIIRKNAYLHNIPIVTTIRGASAFIKGIKSFLKRGIEVKPLQKFYNKLD